MKYAKGSQLPLSPIIAIQRHTQMIVFGINLPKLKNVQHSPAANIYHIIS